MSADPNWTDILTAFGTVGATLFGGVGTWVSLRLYRNEKQHRAEDQERHQKELDEAEQRQARLISAWSEPVGNAVNVVVRNDSDQPIPQVVAMYRVPGAPTRSIRGLQLHITEIMWGDQLTI